MDRPGPEEKPVSAEQLSCGRCGAKLDFAPGTGTLECPYCGFRLPIAPPETPVRETDYRDFLEKAGKEKESDAGPRVRCDKCGAETTMPPEAASGVCPFCGANMVFSAGVSRLIKPEALLPFKIRHAEAFASFRNWIRSRWFAPGSLRQHAQSGSRLIGVYTPFWTYDSDTTTSYEGDRGEYHYTTENVMTRVQGRPVQRSRRVRHTRWHAVSGTVSNGFDDILVPAGRSLPVEYVGQLDPWDLKNLVPYADDYLSGFRAESYGIRLTEGFEAAKRNMEAAIHGSICRDIGGDEQRIRSSNTRYDNITFKHILLPVWISAYRFHGKTYRILINGRTGEVQGDRPYSAWKIAALILAILAIAAILIALGTHG